MKIGDIYKWTGNLKVCSNLLTKTVSADWLFIKTIQVLSNFIETQKNSGFWQAIVLMPLLDYIYFTNKKLLKVFTTCRIAEWSMPQHLVVGRGLLAATKIRSIKKCKNHVKHLEMPKSKYGSITSITVRIRICPKLTVPYHKILPIFEYVPSQKIWKNLIMPQP